MDDECQFKFQTPNAERERERERECRRKGFMRWSESDLNMGRRRFTVSVCVKLKLNPAFALS